MLSSTSEPSIPLVPKNRYGEICASIVTVAAVCTTNRDPHAVLKALSSTVTPVSSVQLVYITIFKIPIDEISTRIGTQPG